jgi:hypothetical protein
MREFVTRWWDTHSAAALADKISAQFGIRCSRDAAIGTAFRLGLCNRKGTGKLPDVSLRNHNSHKPKPKPDWKPKVQQIKRRTFGIQCPCRLIELEDRNCHWPIGDPIADKDFHFCGAWVSADEPPLYCDAHRALAFNHSRPD